MYLLEVRTLYLDKANMLSWRDIEIRLIGALEMELRFCRNNAVHFDQALIFLQMNNIIL